MHPSRACIPPAMRRVQKMVPRPHTPFRSAIANPWRTPFLWLREPTRVTMRLPPYASIVPLTLSCPP